MANKSTIITTSVGIIVLAVIAAVGRGLIEPAAINPLATEAPFATSSAPVPSSSPKIVYPRVSVLADGFVVPWDFAFLPDGGMLITERGGNIVHLTSDGNRVSLPIPRPKPKGEGGLLGITLHPQFADNHHVYVYMTTEEAATGTVNAVFRYTFINGTLSNEKTIISGIPGALYHDGGRMEFGPDGFLYITTGDAQDSKIAQDIQSLGGKILRLTDDGDIPIENPYSNAVYSYGHRNPQGIVWDSKDDMWSTEHGRSGVASGYDEINLIESGRNYGWPKAEGPAEIEGMISPILQSGAKDTWAPASLAYLNGKLYFGGLKGEALYEATISDKKVIELKKYFLKEFGRIRTVRVGPDGMLYLSTSNRDGRGTPKSGDDKIIRVNPELL
jgi:glucose/arabinose dehydrogenase